jgi:hypothetical protein
VIVRDIHWTPPLGLRVSKETSVSIPACSMFKYVLTHFSLVIFNLRWWTVGRVSTATACTAWGALLDVYLAVAVNDIRDSGSD